MLFLNFEVLMLESKEETNYDAYIIALPKMSNTMVITITISGVAGFIYI